MNNKTKNLLNLVLIILGTLCFGLGVLGIFLPLLPTTPFLLLAAALYARSSKTFYNWLLANKLFGKYIENYRKGKGIPMKAKITTISLLWVTIMVSIVFKAENLFVGIILILIAIGVSIHIISIRTTKKLIKSLPQKTG